MKQDTYTLKIKFIFGTLFALVLFSLFFVQMRYSNAADYYEERFLLSTNFLFAKYSTSDYASCHIQISEKTIVIRMDDLGRSAYYDVVDTIVKEIDTRNLALVMGVIPQGIEKDRKFRQWVQQYNHNPQFEFALHGLQHTQNEFMGLTEEEARELILTGKYAIHTYLNVDPVTFIPPYNVYSEGTLKALKESGFKVVSGPRDEFALGNISAIGFSGRTYDFAESYFVPVADVLAECEKSLHKNNVCVIMIHPQDYLIKDAAGKNTKVIDETKYAEFLKLLDGVQKIDAVSKTFRDLLVCSE